MHSARAIWFCVGTASLLCLPAAAAWGWQGGAAEHAAARIPAGVSAPSTVEAGFRHGSHLPPDWAATDRKGQFEKHCQVCHDFAKGTPSGLGAVTQRCALCHYSDSASAEHDVARLEFSGGVRPPGQPLAYDHSLAGHRDLACLECHTSSPGPRGDFAHPDVKFGTHSTLAMCADCHHHGANDPGTKSQQAVFHDGSTAAWRATWDRAQACDDCHKAGAPRLLDRHRRSKERLFEHASHVPASDLGSASAAASCKSCHVVDAAGSGAMGIEQRSCGQCHFGDAGSVTTRAAADRRAEWVPTRFSHATKGHQEKCSTCHPMANDASDPVIGGKYTDCTTSCHAERRVPRHGSWSCDECHAHANPGTEDEAKALRTTQVTRPGAPSKFAFGASVHPGISAGAAAVHPVADGRACGECHRRAVDALTRATDGRPFTHEGHLQDLSVNTPSAACVKCHDTVGRTKSAEFVFAFHAEAAREARSCTATCHRSPKMDVTASTEPVTVPVFSHQQHESQPCASCHVGAGGVIALRGATLVDEGEGVFACARCHGHKDPEKRKVTGGYDTTKTTNVCFECHVAKASGELRRKEERREQRFELVADQRQFHDKGGDCRKCHGFEESTRPPAPAAIRVASHRSLHESHTVTGGGATRTLGAVKLKSQTPDSCLSCHAWQPRRL